MRRVVVVFAAAMVFSACGNDGEVEVGAPPVPHGEAADLELMEGNQRFSVTSVQCSADAVYTVEDPYSEVEKKVTPPDGKLFCLVRGNTINIDTKRIIRLGLMSRMTLDDGTVVKSELEVADYAINKRRDPQPLGSSIKKPFLPGDHLRWQTMFEIPTGKRAEFVEVVTNDGPVRFALEPQ